MSKNIDQIYTTNPITTNAPDDLLYVGQSPYGTGDDAAIKYSDFESQLSGATEAQVQSSSFNTGTDTGIADAYVVDLTPAVTSLTDGLLVSFTPVNLSTAQSPTLDVGTGPIPISLIGFNSLVPNDMGPTQVAYLQYNLAANQFFLLTPLLSYIDLNGIQGNAYISSADQGTVNALEANPVRQQAYGAGSFFVINGVDFTNTGPSTLSVAGTPLPIVLPDGSALVGGEIIANQSYLFFNVQALGWVLLNSSLSSSGVTPSQVQQGAFNNGTDTGAADAYVVALNPAITSLTNGMIVIFTPLNNNLTGAPTIDVGTGPIQVFLGGPASPQPLSPSDFQNQTPAVCVYDVLGAWILLNPCSGPTSADVQGGAFNIGMDSGIADAYVVTLQDTSLQGTPLDGWVVNFRPQNNNATTSPTLNVQGSGVHPMRLPGGGLIPIGAISTSYTCSMQFCASSSQWIWMNPTVELHTWTPVFTFSSPGNLTTSYSIQTGTYTKVGNLVMATFVMTVTPTYTTATGNILITGLPFASNSSNGNIFIPICTSTMTYPAGVSSPLALLTPGSPIINIYGGGSAISFTPFTVLNAVSGTSVALSGTITYLV